MGLGTVRSVHIVSVDLRSGCNGTRWERMTIAVGCGVQPVFVRVGKVFKTERFKKGVQDAR